MDDYDILQLLDRTDQLAVPADFTFRFWERVARRERKVHFFRRLVPVATFLFLFLFPVRTRLQQIVSRQNQEIVFHQLAEDTLIEESILRLGLSEVSTNVLSSEEIVEILVPKEILLFSPGNKKGGERL